MSIRYPRSQKKILASDNSCLKQIRLTLRHERSKLWEIVKHTLVSPRARRQAQELIFTNTKEPYPE